MRWGSMRDAITNILWNNGIYSGYIGMYRDNGKENANYYQRLGCRAEGLGVDP